MVTAIITTHNRLELLKRAVQSVFCQTDVEIELIVVDDASTDGTQNWCINQPFKYIRVDPKNSRGGNYARNLGIKSARGEVIAFLDDDDYWLPDKTITQLKLMKDRGCDVVYGGRRLEIIKDGSIRYNDALPFPDSSGDMSKKILQHTCATTTTIMVTKRLLEDVGYFDEALDFWQEYELTIRLAQQSKFYYVNNPVAVYRIDEKDPSRLTNKFHGWLNAVKYIQHKHIKLYSNLSLRDKIKSKGFIFREAYWRAKTARLKSTSFKYLMLSFLFSPFHTFHKAILLLRHQR